MMKPSYLMERSPRQYPDSHSITLQPPAPPAFKLLRTTTWPFHNIEERAETTVVLFLLLSIWNTVLFVLFFLIWRQTQNIILPCNTVLTFISIFVVSITQFKQWLKIRNPYSNLHSRWNCNSKSHFHIIIKPNLKSNTNSTLIESRQKQTETALHLRRSPVPNITVFFFTNRCCFNYYSSQSHLTDIPSGPHRAAHICPGATHAGWGADFPRGEAGVEEAAVEEPTPGTTTSLFLARIITRAQRKSIYL